MILCSKHKIKKTTDFSMVLVREEGLEPSRCYPARDFKSRASTVPPFPREKKCQRRDYCTLIPKSQSYKQDTLKLFFSALLNS